MEKTMTLNGSRVIVVYEVDMHGQRVMQRVELPGDRMEITDQLSDDELKKVHRSLNRK
jgi:hypothetical protein